MKLINILKNLGSAAHRKRTINKSDEGAPPSHAKHQSKSMAGCIELVQPTRITGWCINSKNISESPALELYINDNYVYKFMPTIHRKDVVEQYPGADLTGFNLHIGSELAKAILKCNTYHNDSVAVSIKISDQDIFLEVIGGVEATLKLSDIKSIAEGEYFKSRDPFYVRFERLRAANASKKSLSASNDDVKVIAFYLPQFHPFPENNEWWGEGFTEWTNVVKSKPLFPEHYQPHLPADLGFYDLRLASVRERQAQLANEYGIYGFCYHYYWFGGRPLMDGPINDLLESGKPNFPFCICWANEPWSRRWDGSENEVLLAQPHDLDTDERFIIDIMAYLKDSRYIRVNGAPMLIIYRLSLIPNPQELFRRWRLIAADNGIADLHIVMAETFGAEEPYKYGCDAAVGFPPHRVTASEISKKVIDGNSEEFEGKIYDYRDVVSSDISQINPDYPLYRGVMPSWDNTARRGKSGHIFHRSSPELYEVWLRLLVENAKTVLPPGQRFIFINAWNEWAEGAHLEPDRKFGREYLDATRRAITGHINADSALISLELNAKKTDRHVTDSTLQVIRAELEALRRSNEYMSRQYISTHHHINVKKGTWFKENGFPIDQINWSSKHARAHIERVNQYTGEAIRGEIILSKSQFLEVIGWVFLKGWKYAGQLYAVAQSGNDIYVSLIRNRFDRLDVNHAYPGEVNMPTGFEVSAPLSGLSLGSYNINLVITDGATWEGVHCPFRVQVI